MARKKSQLESLVTHNKIKILFLILILPVLCAVTFSLLNNPGAGELYRGRFEGIPGLEPGKNVYHRIAVRANENVLTVNIPRDYEKCFSSQGTFLCNQYPDEKSSVNLNHELSGKYMIDFFCCFPPKANMDAEAFLEIYPRTRTAESKPLMSIKLEKDVFLKRNQIPVKIKKDDILVFSLKGKGIVFFTQPVFYRDEAYKKKELVFIISVDTLRRDHVGVYNSKKKTTPEIDRFARDAVVFKNAYSSSSWTLPAHVSLFTGMYAHRHHLNFLNKKKNINLKHTLFQLLQKKYITVSLNGAVFLSHLFGFSQGFDCYYEMDNDCENQLSARFLFLHARRFIDEDHSNVPLLFFLHTYQVHSLFCPEEELAKEYFKDTSFKYNSFDILDLTEQGKNQYKKDVGAGEREEIIKVYDAGIYTFDYWFGQFIRYLKEKELYHDSLIILLSDHGEAFRDHGGWEHGHSLYNELIKIPLLVKFPGNKWAGTAVDPVVSIVDILPTLLELNKINYRDKLQIECNGVSLLEVMKAGETNREVISYLAPYACSRTPLKIALVSREFKLICNKLFTDEDIDYFRTPPPRIIPNEFYNLLEDEGESTNTKNSNRAEFSDMIKKIKKLKYERTKTVFPDELKEKLKQLGYIN